MNNVQSDIVAWEIREGQKQSERSAAEQAYSVIAFDYAKAPVGSRDWCLFWNGWQACLHPRESGDQVAPRRDERPMAAESLAFEAWRTEQIECLKRNGYADAADAFYKLGSIHWLAWQARAALNQQGTDAEHLQKIAAVAHCGGLAGLSEAEALEIIRRVTLPHFVKSMRAEDNVRAIDAAIAAKDSAS